MGENGRADVTGGYRGFGSLLWFRVVHTRLEFRTGACKRRIGVLVGAGSLSFGINGLGVVKFIFHFCHRVFGLIGDGGFNAEAQRNAEGRGEGGASSEKYGDRFRKHF
jgi:hypothetical protein